MWTILHSESSTGWGGQEIRILLELTHLHRRGHSLGLIAPPDSPLARRAEAAGIPVWGVPIRGPVDIAAIRRVRGIIRQTGAHLLNTHSSGDAWAAGLAARLAGIPILRTRHLSVPLKRNPISRFVYRGLCDRIVATGEGARRRLIEEAGVPPKKVIAIPTGVDLAQFDPAGIDGGKVRRELDIPPDAPVVGAVAVLRRNKGHRVLIEACARVAAARPDVRVVVAGDGPWREALRDQAERLGLGERVRFLGHREDVPEVLASLDVLVLPSLAAEGVPQALAQGMAMGRAVVASRVDGLTELVRDGETGVLVEPGDAAALARAILGLLADPDRRRRLGAAARAHAARSCSVEGMVARLEALYAELLGGERAPAKNTARDQRQPSAPRILDVGCGMRKRPGATGIDGNPRAQADVVHDLNRVPWPLPDDAFDLIYCHHVIEHMDDVVRTMEEIHRVGRPGAIVEIVTPHFSSLYSWQDPTHRHHLALDSFDYFTAETPHTNFYTDRRFRVLEKRIQFGRSLISIIPRIIYALSPHLYERHFCLIFPANDLFFRLEVVKGDG